MKRFILRNAILIGWIFGSMGAFVAFGSGAYLGFHWRMVHNRLLIPETHRADR